MIITLTTERIQKYIQDAEQSPVKRRLKQGRRYYEGRHDILDYQLWYYNADGKPVEDKTRSNIKIPHAFFTELVDQCVQYMLSNPEPLVCSDDGKLQKELDAYFGDDFRAELAEALTDMCFGVGHLYAYKTTDDRTAFVYADAQGVITVRKRDTADKADYVIYWYIDFADGKEVKRVQVWDTAAVHYFVQVESGRLEPDPSEELNPRPHVVYSEPPQEGRFGEALGYIPFFEIANGRQKTSQLAAVKALIDDYDLMACGLSNNLQDVSEGITLVKGMDGSNIDELMHNVRVKKTVGVPEGGDLDIRTVQIPYEARRVRLELDEKNIYRFGMGFNSAQIGDGNITNVVIKSRYALLDLKCDKMAAQLRKLLRQLLNVVLPEINERHTTDYQQSDVYFDLAREVITNAADNAQIALSEAQEQQTRVNTLLDAAAKLDSETVLQALCDLLDVDYEDVKDRLPKNPQADLNAASEALAAAPVE